MCFPAFLVFQHFKGIKYYQRKWEKAQKIHTCDLSLTHLFVNGSRLGIHKPVASATLETQIPKCARVTAANPRVPQYLQFQGTHSGTGHLSHTKRTSGSRQWQFQHELSSTTYLSLMPYLCECGSSMVTVIKSKDRVENRCGMQDGGRGGEQGWHSEFEVWEVVQCPTGTHSPLLSNWSWIRKWKDFFDLKTFFGYLHF